MQCVPFHIGSVGGSLRTQLQPYVGTCVFPLLHNSRLQRASEQHRGKTLCMPIAGFTEEMWPRRDF